MPGLHVVAGTAPRGAKNLEGLALTSGQGTSTVELVALVTAEQQIGGRWSRTTLSARLFASFQAFAFLRRGRVVTVGSGSGLALRVGSAVLHQRVNHSSGDRLAHGGTCCCKHANENSDVSDNAASWCDERAVHKERTKSFHQVFGRATVADKNEPRNEVLFGIVGDCFGFVSQRKGTQPRGHLLRTPFSYHIETG